MDVIIRPADFQELAFLVGDNSANLGVGFRSEQIRQGPLAVLCAEDDVIDEARVAAGHGWVLRCRPFGARQVFVLLVLGLTPQAIPCRRSAASKSKDRKLDGVFPGMEREQWKAA